MKSTYTRTISYIKMKLVTLFVRARAFTLFFGKIFVHRKVFETNISKIGFETVSKIKVDVRLAQSDDILRLVKLKRFGKGLRRDHLCFIAEKNGGIVFHSLVCFNDLYLNVLERKMRIGHDSAHIYSYYTVPEYRCMGIATAGTARALDYLFQNGIKRVYVLIFSYNLASQRVVEKTGFRKIGEITLIRLFMLRRYRCKGETPKDSFILKEMFSI